MSPSLTVSDQHRLPRLLKSLGFCYFALDPPVVNSLKYTFQPLFGFPHSLLLIKTCVGVGTVHKQLSGKKNEAGIFF